MERKEPKIFDVVFFETANGNQPARDIIKGLPKNDQKEIGADIRVVQNSYPIGLPLVKKLKPDLWEIRSMVKNGIFRVFFTIHNEKIILLHAIMKKTKKTPIQDLDLAVVRLKELKKLQQQDG